MPHMTLTCVVDVMMVEYCIPRGNKCQSAFFIIFFVFEFGRTRDPIGNHPPTYTTPWTAQSPNEQENGSIVSSPHQHHRQRVPSSLILSDRSMWRAGLI